MQSCNALRTLNAAAAAAALVAVAVAVAAVASSAYAHTAAHESGAYFIAFVYIYI